MNRTIRASLLHALYDTYDARVDGSQFACRKGCASCCTQSVTVTALEARIILEFIREQGIVDLPSLTDKLRRQKPTAPICTTNEFAAACLGEKELPEDREWDFTPCLFLEHDSCIVYPARPFMCRSFASTGKCDDQGAASLPEYFISLNTALMQVIEHIDQGHVWGNMNDVLVSLLDRNTEEGGERASRPGLLLSRVNPGFLIPPEDEGHVLPFLKVLYSREVAGRSFGDWLDGLVAGRL